MSEIEQIKKAIAALEAQRTLLGDDVVDTALAPLREKLDALLVQEHSSEQHRKLVTVLFTDVTGSTNLSQRLDPEDMMAIMDGAMQRFNKVIERNGGRVLNFMGDGLMAVFGTPLAREDDAERAIRAGLDIVQDAQDYARQVESKWGLSGLNVRVGINTGPVILGGGVSDDNTAVGMAINLAARMESAAPVGGIRITHDTYRHVHGLFELEAQPPILVKGKDEPIQTYVIKGVRPKEFRTVTRGVEGLQTRMIGREVEFKKLIENFHSVIQNRLTHVVSVIADPGVGKSRLLFEFENWLAGQDIVAHRLQARAAESIVNIPYSLLRDLFAFRFNILDNDPVAVVRDKLETGLLEYLKPEGIMKAHFIGALIGFDFSNSPYLQSIRDDPKQLRDRGLHYLAQFIGSIAQESPTVFLLDDLHWADGPSLDAIHHIVRDLPELPLLILCFSRPTLFERRPDWQQHFSPAQSTRIDLHPLNQYTSNQLVKEILKNVDHIPMELSSLIVTNSEGNPFYVEELVNILIDDGVILKDRESGKWWINNARLSDMRVPPTLTAVLQARIDSLPVDERITLQQASIAGRSFWDALLFKLQNGNEELVRVLKGLADRELIFIQPLSAFDETREYLFKHNLLRDVTYETVLKRERQDYHGKVAEWLVDMTRASNRETEYAALIAEHYEMAGMGNMAADWLLQAGKRAVAQGAYLEARDIFLRALELLQPNDYDRRWQSLLGLDTVLASMGVLEDRKTNSDLLLNLALEKGDDFWIGEANYRYGFLEGSLGNYQAELRAYDEALAASRRAGDRVMEARVLGVKVVTLSKLGDIELAAKTAVEALAGAQASGDDPTLARALSNCSVYYTSAGDLGKAVELLNKALVVAHRMGDPYGEALVLGNLGYSYILLGLPGLGQAVLERSMLLANTIGARQQQIYNNLNLGLARLRNGQGQSAQEVLVKALSELEILGDIFGWAANLAYLALAMEQSHEFNYAVENFRKAWTAFHDMGARGYETDALAGLARSLFASNRSEEASDHLDILWREMESNGTQGMEFPSLAYQTCIDLFKAFKDERIEQAVEAGFEDLIARARKISDIAWRKSFLQNVPEHRRIIEMKRFTIGEIIF